MKNLIPKILERDINLYLFEGSKLFMFETYAEEHAVFIEHGDGDVTIASWAKGSEEVEHFNISKDVRNSLANYLAIKEDLQNNEIGQSKK
jgi:hypothetical protein